MKRLDVESSSHGKILGHPVLRALHCRERDAGCASCSGVEQVERLRLDGEEIARETRQRGVEVGAGMRLDRIAQRVDPAAQVGVEEAPLRRQVARRRRRRRRSGSASPRTGWRCGPRFRSSPRCAPGRARAGCGAARRAASRSACRRGRTSRRERSRACRRPGTACRTRARSAPRRAGARRRRARPSSLPGTRRRPALRSPRPGTARAARHRAARRRARRAGRRPRRAPAPRRRRAAANAIGLTARSPLTAR